MGIFNQLYKIKEEVKDALNKPLVERKVRRQFESALDTLEKAKIDGEEKLSKAREKIANGEGTDKDFTALAEAKVSLSDIDLQIKTLTDERDAFFSAD